MKLYSCISNFNWLTVICVTPYATCFLSARAPCVRARSNCCGHRRAHAHSTTTNNTVAAAAAAVAATAAPSFEYEFREFMQWHFNRRAVVDAFPIFLLLYLLVGSMKWVLSGFSVTDLFCLLFSLLAIFIATDDKMLCACAIWKLHFSQYFAENCVLSN